MNDVALFFHLLGALLFVAGIVLAGVAFEVARRRERPAEIALYVISLALGAAGGRQPKRARRLATRLAAEGSPASGELRALLDDRSSLAANYASAALVLAIRAATRTVGFPSGKRCGPTTPEPWRVL